MKISNAVFLILMIIIISPSVSNAEGGGVGEGIDSVAPFMVGESSKTGDADNDGKIDFIDVMFSENISSSPGKTDFIVNGFTVKSVSRSNADKFRVFLDESGSFDTGARPSVSIGSAAVDEASNKATTHAITPIDGAWPVLVGAVPSQGGKLSSASGSFTLQFSENLKNESITTETIVVEGAGEPKLSISESGGVVTVRQAAGSFESNTRVTVTAMGDFNEIQDMAGNPLNSAGVVFGTNVGDDVTYNFMTPVASQTDEDEESSQASAMQDGGIAVVTPNTSGSLRGRTIYPITWATQGSVNNVVLYYSVDGGAHYYLIASGESNDGAYSWSVPNLDTSRALVKIVARKSDGSTLSSDESDQAFSIISNTMFPEDTIEQFEFSVLMKTTEGRDIELHEGNVFRGESLTDVYLIESDGTRSVFPDELTYFSWYENFDDVIFVKDTELGKLSLGKRVTIKPGSWLVKIQSVPNVYEITDGAVLHHIPDEATAARLYGEDWSLFVRDIPIVFFLDYTIGRSL